MRNVSTTRTRLGFSLIELMIVVVIMGILATVAASSYTRFSRRARLQEAVSFLADIRIKQETYYQTYHRYVSTGANENDFWPAAMDWKKGNPWGFDCNVAAQAAAHPGWCSLGASFLATQEVYFQYVAVGRNPTNPVVPNAQYIKDSTRDWWYARAAADFDSNGVFSDIWLSSELREPIMLNELE